MKRKRRSVERRRESITTSQHGITPLKKWKVGDQVYFTKYPGEQHVVIAILPANRKPESYEKKIDEGFVKHTPMMNKKLKLSYQQAGMSLWCMETWKEPSYFIAGKPDCRWGWMIHVRRARSEELSEKPVPDPDDRGNNLYKR